MLPLTSFSIFFEQCNYLDNQFIYNVALYQLLTLGVYLDTQFDFYYLVRALHFNLFSHIGYTRCTNESGSWVVVGFGESLGERRCLHCILILSACQGKKVCSTYLKYMFSFPYCIPFLKTPQVQKNTCKFARYALDY